MDKGTSRKSTESEYETNDIDPANRSQVESVEGPLTSFILEPFLPHPSNTEYYVCINSDRAGDTILFTHEGGVDVGDVDAKALKLLIPVLAKFPGKQAVITTLLTHVPTEAAKNALADFIIRLYSVYVDLHYAYLEINPLICMENKGKFEIHYLDMAAKLDQTAESIVGMKWAIARDLGIYGGITTSAKGVTTDRGPPMVFPAPFGRSLTKEEAYVQKTRRLNWCFPKTHRSQSRRENLDYGCWRWCLRGVLGRYRCRWLCR